MTIQPQLTLFALLTLFVTVFTSPVSAQDGDLPTAVSGIRTRETVEMSRFVQSAPGALDSPQFFSHNVMPTTIRVAITGYLDGYAWSRAGKPIIRIDTISFRDYVKGVLPNEWVSSWPMDSLKAGAVAAKMFGWWRINYPRHTNYDVVDNTFDQVYRPSSRNERTDTAVDDTWGYAMRRDGRVISIHYVDTDEHCNEWFPGTPCMGQWGSKYRADEGKNWQEILHYYYDPVTISRLTPAPPSDLAATASSPTQVRLSWRDNSDDEAQFTVHRRTGSGAFGQVGVTGTNLTSLTVSGLTCGTGYTFRVRAENSVGPSEWSGERNITTPLCPAPTQAPATASPPNSATTVDRPRLVWRSVPNALRYQLQVWRVENGTLVQPPVINRLVQALEYTPTTGLTDGTYQLRVRGENTGRYGPWSGWVTFRVSAAAPLRWRYATGTPTLSWSRLAGVTQSQIQIAFTPDFATPRTITITGSANSYTFTSALRRGIVFYWRVRVMSNGVWTEWSPADSFVIVL